MKAIKKLNALSNEELQGIRGGVIPTDDFTLFSSDNNNKKECRCDGPGKNNNNASKCYCTDIAGCSSSEKIVPLDPIKQ